MGDSHSRTYHAVGVSLTSFHRRQFVWDLQQISGMKMKRFSLFLLLVQSTVGFVVEGGWRPSNRVPGGVVTGSPSAVTTTIGTHALSSVTTIRNAAVLYDAATPELEKIVPSLQVRVVQEMPEALPLDLKHNYYLLRHGQSTANVDSIISSSRSLAYTDKHGLTSKGYQQGRESATQLLDFLRETAQPGDEVLFVSSPFARAHQTAQACLDELTELELDLDLSIHKTIALNDGLVERYFGRLDGEAIYTYAYVWPLDMFNATHTAFDVESVAAVCTRIRETILHLEKKYVQVEESTKHIVLVSHADTLQIAKLYAARADNVGLFSSYRFQNGEVRRMILGSTNHFPSPVPLQGPKRCTKEKLKTLDQ